MSRTDLNGERKKINRRQKKCFNVKIVSLDIYGLSLFSISCVCDRLAVCELQFLLSSIYRNYGFSQRWVVAKIDGIYEVTKL